MTVFHSEIDFGGYYGYSLNIVDRKISLFNWSEIKQTVEYFMLQILRTSYSYFPMFLKVSIHRISDPRFSAIEEQIIIYPLHIGYFGVRFTLGDSDVRSERITGQIELKSQSGQILRAILIINIEY